MTGRITDAATSAPVVGARVVITGTQLTALTGDDGKYTIRAINAGPAEIAANRLGYQPKKVSATFANGQAMALDFTMSIATYSLSAVVTTVSGNQRKVELANSTTQIDVCFNDTSSPT